MKFGEYLQKVCEVLVEDHQWDDPYGTLAPGNDKDAILLDLIHDQYHLGIDPKTTAEKAATTWLELPF